MPPDQPIETLEARLKAQIAAHGPIGIAEYMQACLSDRAGGYYATRDPLGAKGDFVTAPEISQIFGELLGVWCVVMWQTMGEPDRLILAELGPGRGSLLRDALRSWRKFPDFRKSLQLALVETSPVLRESQAEALDEAATFDPPIPISWHESLDTVPQGPLLVIANEFLDALPVRQFVRRGQAWRERLVGLDSDGALTFVEAEEETAGEADLTPFEALAGDGAIAELRPGTKPLLDALAARTSPFTALFIDYGNEAPSPADTLQAVSNHAYAAALETPGEADLTAHVDFSALADQARSKDLCAYGPMPQGAFLLKLGLASRHEQLQKTATPDQRAMLSSGANRLIDPQQMGVLFKAFMVTAAGMPAPPPFPPDSPS